MTWSAVRRDAWRDFYATLGVIGWTWRDVEVLTLNEVTNAYDAKLLHDWDQTGTIAAVVYNVGVIVASFGKCRARPRTMQDFNPYRERTRKGMRITADDIGVLKLIGDTMARGK